MKDKTPSGPERSVEEQAKEFDTKVISAFPGTGKTWFVNNSSFKCLDSDSSKFDKSRFPDNYIEHIQENIGKCDYIFVSTHQEVRDAMMQAAIKFITIYPHMSCRKEYLQRYKDRGSDQNFINTLDVMWQKWIEDLDYSYGGASIRLARGLFISDVFLFKAGFLAASSKGKEEESSTNFYEDIYEGIMEDLKKYCIAGAYVEVRQEDGEFFFDCNLKDCVYIISGLFPEESVIEAFENFDFSDIDKEGLWEINCLLSHSPAQYGDEGRIEVQDYLMIEYKKCVYQCSFEEKEQQGKELKEFDLFGNKKVDESSTLLSTQQGEHEEDLFLQLVADIRLYENNSQDYEEFIIQLRSKYKIYKK